MANSPLNMCETNTNMAKLKTQANDASVEDFLATVSDENKRRDCNTLLQLMQRITAAEPTMWGDSIVGFGEYHYRYASGRSGEWFVAGFSPRKQNLTIYIMSGFEGCDDLMAQLGKYKLGKCCLYVKKLDDIDMNILEKLIKHSATTLTQSKE